MSDTGRVANEGEAATGELYVEEPVVEVDETVNTETQEPQYEIPNKFQNKSIEDVAKSYSELEKSFGRQEEVS